MTDGPEPGIIDSAGQTFVGIAELFDMIRRGEIAALFDRIFVARDGIDGALDCAVYGLSFDTRPVGSFRYAVAVEVPEPAEMPHGFCVLRAAVDAHAVCRQRTKAAEAPARLDAFFSQWSPNAPFCLRQSAVLERTPTDPAPQQGKMLNEILVPATPVTPVTPV